MINLIVTFYIIGMPMQVQYFTQYASPHLCAIAMDQQRLHLPKPPFRWHTAVVSCVVAQ